MKTSPSLAVQARNITNIADRKADFQYALENDSVNCSGSAKHFLTNGNQSDWFS